ncbi:hypothetical protein SAMN05421688_0551 [Poseidonocella pacifica]|uniref:Lipase (Class 3) n=1 Tax=Poseidonocella pacifica TaxID=871651 RepID=A0A1I0VE83_9RHOB|nr:hypothetical protein [Poseidonocella pacifica]SFA74548.1 hypothetical protein SAMN05421688_0551 [Poseidonocella pacifica]
MAGDVRTRAVFYIPGFDPFPPRRYRELYRREAAQQAQISGYRLKLRGEGSARWVVEAEIDGVATRSEFEVLSWSDLVQRGMGGGIGASYIQLLSVMRAYLGSGAFPAMLRLRKGPVLAALYPVLMLLGQLFFAILLGVILGGVHWALGAAAFAAVLWAGYRADRYLYAYYLLHDYAYTARDGGEISHELSDRLATFTARIREALEGDVDEVLVVGHSSGAHLAVIALADLLRGGAPAGPQLSLLTLGHVTPMAAFLPRAWRLRRDLRALSTAEGLNWVDVTAPGDGCCFALCDPVAVCGVAPEAQTLPLVMSARFSETLSAERQRQMRWRFFRIHFQYLCAFDAPMDYDYFAITAGPTSLGARFKGRAHSPSRIARAASPHRSLSP